MKEEKLQRIKSAAEYKRGELAKDILRIIGSGASAPGFGSVALNTLQLVDCFNPKGRDERNKVWKSIKYLEAKNRIRFHAESDGHTSVHLTKAGETTLSEVAIDELAVKQPRRWDRKWRLVMFDIPARHEKARQPFRSKLEDLGFRLYQRSVFIYPYECHEEVHTVAKWYGVDEFIRYVVATELHDMREYAQLFDLL